MTTIWRLDDAAQLGLFGAQTLIQTRRQYEYVSGPNKGKRSEVETVFHASSQPIDEHHGVAYFADAIRGQWTIENGYHGRRDGAYCEDKYTRRCNENILGALLLARTPVFVYFAQSGQKNCQVFKEQLQLARTKSYNLVMGNQRSN